MFWLLEGIERLRALGICHRDVKPQNILYSLTQRCYKIGDFSESKRLTEAEADADALHTGNGNNVFIVAKLD